MSKVDELEFIMANHDKLHTRDIAKVIGKTEKYVRDVIRKRIKHGAETRYDEVSTKTTVFWDELKQQFTENELRVFERHWKEINQQFQGDVFHTERMQIIDMLKFDILMNRILKEQKEIADSIENLNKLADLERKKPPGVQDMDRLFDLEKQILTNRGLSRESSKNFLELSEKKKGLMTALKATRADRKKSIQESKVNFQEFLRVICTDFETRKSLGENAEKLRLASVAEMDRLNKPFQYSDGFIDIPLLNSVSISNLDEGI